MTEMISSASGGQARRVGTTPPILLKKGAMSQHIVEQENKKFVFGWDQPLMSFFLQVFDRTLLEEERMTVWAGATKDSQMYEVDDLVVMARRYGLDIPYETQVKLYREKDEGS